MFVHAQDALSRTRWDRMCTTIKCHQSLQAVFHAYPIASYIWWGEYEMEQWKKYGASAVVRTARHAASLSSCIGDSASLPYRLFITDIALLVGYPYSCAY